MIKLTCAAAAATNSFHNKLTLDRRALRSLVPTSLPETKGGFSFVRAMLETRSAVYKMLKTSAHEERQINDWPPPFTSEVTPYSDQSDFNNLVRRACTRKSLAPRISKAIVLGDVAVGKTSLVNRFCHKSFDNNYKATIGVDFEVERFDILGAPFNLQIWDTAGQERFKCIAASYYRGANVIMIVFDLGSLMSLSHCHQWLVEASRSNAAGHCVIFLVGTKRDLLSSQVYNVIEKRAFAVARTLGAEYWAVSARTGDGIAELFARVAALSFDASVRRELRSISDRDTLTLGSNLTGSKNNAAKHLDIKDRKALFKWTICSIL